MASAVDSSVSFSAQVAAPPQIPGSVFAAAAIALHGAFGLAVGTLHGHEDAAQRAEMAPAMIAFEIETSAPVVEPLHVPPPSPVVLREPPRVTPIRSTTRIEPASAPLAAAPATTPTVAEVAPATTVVSSEAGLAVAAQAGSAFSLGTRNGTATGAPTIGPAHEGAAAPAIDRRALLMAYRARLDAAIGTPPPLRGLRDPLDVTVIVAITIDAAGHLVDARVGRSSGNPGIDAHAVEFLSSLGSLPAPPAELDWGRRPVLYPMHFVVR